MNDQKPVDPKSEVKPTVPDAPAPVDPKAPSPAPGQQPAAQVNEVDADAQRQARLLAIDDELVRADRDLAEVQNRITSLRNERDAISRQGIGPAMSQAEALKHVVESDQAQRMHRAQVVAAVTGMLGGGKVPTVKTPAEIKAAMKPKTPPNLPPLKPQ